MPTGPIFELTATITGSPGQSGPAINVWHFTTDNATATIQLSVDKIRDFYTSNSALFASAASVVVGSKVVRIAVPADGSPAEFIAVTPRVVVGTGGSQAQAPQVAMVASWRTLFAGPSFRGRTYLGPLSTTVMATGGGSFSTTVIATATTAANALLTALSTVPAQLVVLSRTRGVYTAISSGAVNAVPDTQRRRVQ